MRMKKWIRSLAAVSACMMMLCAGTTTAFAYSDPEAETETPPVIEEVPPTEEEKQIFTDPGNGEVQDDITNSSDKEFFTIKTKNNNTFYLVIDRSRNGENVYMLSQIDENDLAEFLEEKPEKEDEKPSVIIEEKPTVQEPEIKEPEPVKKDTAKSASAMVLLMTLLAGGAGIGAYYYIKVYKPKKAEEESESENMEISDGFETINEDEELQTVDEEEQE